jgi:hypothetical protein
MPTISQVLFIKPRPGKVTAFLADVARARKIITRCGASARVWSQTVGRDVGTAALVIDDSRLEDVRGLCLEAGG